MDKQKLEEYIESGMSTTQIAKEEGKGKTTVRYWLDKYGLSTKYTNFKDGYVPQGRILRVDGIPIQHCAKCQVSLTEETGYWLEKKKSWLGYCRKCHNKYTVEKHRNNKKRAVEYKGGKCERCGYDRCIDALEFHHIDPNQKDKSFGNMKLMRWDKQKKELELCILVCANCHREIHSELRNHK